MPAFVAPLSLSSVSIRNAQHDDIPAIQAIYADHVLTRTATFEETPPSVDTMIDRWETITKGGYPYLVAETHQAKGHPSIVGYAYVGPFRPQSAYRFTIEDSIYLLPEAQGQGLGLRLLNALISACEKQGFRQMVAVIGDSANVRSVGLHQAAGFAHIGILPAAGFKFGRWTSIVLMQRPLGKGGTPSRNPVF